MSNREKLTELLELFNMHCECAGQIDCLRDCTECLADHLMANGVTVQEWISVKDRLPEPHTYVICCGEIGGATLGYRMPNREWQGVTHWMPLPEPPKGE